LTGRPFQVLTPWRPHQFLAPEFSNVTIEFVVAGDRVVAMTQRDPSGEYTFPRK
jgi:hypothetical protein